MKRPTLVLTLGDVAGIGPETVARTLLEHAELLAREWGCTRTRMTVIDRRLELLAYYARRGYVPTGRTEPFPSDVPGFGVPKTSVMILLELAKTL